MRGLRSWPARQMRLGDVHVPCRRQCGGACANRLRAFARFVRKLYMHGLA